MIKLFDVVAVNMINHKIRMIAEGKTERSADAIEMIAISRNGCEEEFYASVESGKYKDGDEWNEADEL